MNLNKNSFETETLVSVVHEKKDLAALKSYRNHIYTTPASFGNMLRKKMQTWNSGLPKKELLLHLAALLARDIKYLLPTFLRKPYLPIPVATRPVLVANVEGGIGDLILAVRFLWRFTEIHDLDMVIKCRNPEFASYLLSSCARFLASASHRFDPSNPHVAAEIQIGNFVTCVFIRDNAATQLRTDIEKAAKFVEPYSAMMQCAPFLDGILGDTLASTGRRRHEACFAQFGIPYSHDAYLRPTIKKTDEFLGPLGLRRKCYVTITDGWDAGFGLLNGRRPTKALPPDFFPALIARLGRSSKQLKIVQTGDSNSGNDIEGVDLNLRGKTTLADTALLLAGSVLHIDCEGGLVHLAHAVGTKSAVFFGPTNPDFFSYSDNLMLLPETLCTNCYWTTNTWMAACPLKKEKICMESHPAETSASQILQFISQVAASTDDIRDHVH